MTNHHEHDQEGGCGCGHDHHAHGHDCADHEIVDIELNEDQTAFLRQLAQIFFLPVAQFIVKSTKESAFTSVALQPVFIRSLDDTMEDVRDAGKFLTTLENAGMISLDYDFPLDGYEYQEYKNSELYLYFCQTIEEGKTQEGFLGDTPELVLGSIAPTPKTLKLFEKK